jgi:hypothetical protein
MASFYERNNTMDFNKSLNLLFKVQKHLKKDDKKAAIYFVAFLTLTGGLPDEEFAEHKLLCELKSRGFKFLKSPGERDYATVFPGGSKAHLGSDILAQLGYR